MNFFNILQNCGIIIILGIIAYSSIKNNYKSKGEEEINKIVIDENTSILKNSSKFFLIDISAILVSAVLLIITFELLFNFMNYLLQKIQ